MGAALCSRVGSSPRALVLPHEPVRGCFPTGPCTGASCACTSAIPFVPVLSSVRARVLPHAHRARVLPSTCGRFSVCPRTGASREYFPVHPHTGASLCAHVWVLDHARMWAFLCTGSGATPRTHARVFPCTLMHGCFPHTHGCFLHTHRCYPVCAGASPCLRGGVSLHAWVFLLPSADGFAQMTISACTNGSTCTCGGAPSVLME